MTTTCARRALALRSTSVAREMVCGYRRGGRSLNSRSGDGACVRVETASDRLRLMELARDEADPRGVRDGFAARRHAELSVHGYRLRLDRVSRHIQAVRDLAEREMRREKREQPELCRRERRGSRLSLARDSDLLAQLDRVVAQDLELRSPGKDRVHLGEQLECMFAVAEGRPNARELEAEGHREAAEPVREPGHQHVRRRASRA